MFEIHDPQIYYKSSESMEEIKDNSIQLILTSPPYGKIKDYGEKAQIGFHDSFEDYFQRLNNVWNECYRVLEYKCRIAINIGDQYLRAKDFGRYRILSIASKIIEDCTNIGFDFLGDIIWQKVSTTNTTGGCSLMGSIYYPRNGLLTYDYEHILLFKKSKGKARKISFIKKEMSKIPLSEWKKWFVGHWKFPGTLQKEHVAMFPEQLPYRLIRMFSFIGDTVLDPFVGSGTTLKVAKALFRKSIGYEINKEFKPIIKNKIEKTEKGYFKDYQYLLYLIFKGTQDKDYKILFQEQRQKGILFLQNSNNKKIVIDYLIIENKESSKEELKIELDNKLEENSVQNYLKEKRDWKSFNKYIIIVNANRRVSNFIQKCFNKLKFKKEIHLLFYEQIFYKDFDLALLF